MIKSRDAYNKRPNFTHGDIFQHKVNGGYYLLVCACNGKDNTNKFGFVSLKTGWSYTGHFHNCKNAHNITLYEIEKAIPGFHLVQGGITVGQVYVHLFEFVGLLKGVEKT